MIHLILQLAAIISLICPSWAATDLTGAAVLVTGAAGFIGSHMVVNLVKSGCRSVVAVDNYDASYDIYMKHLRADHVSNSTGIKVHRGDVCTEGLWTKLLGQKAAFQFTHIVHLAYPQDSDHMQCFAFLLEKIRLHHDHTKRPYPHIVYAINESSTSPTSREHGWNSSDILSPPPGSEEQIAQSYRLNSGMGATGFRLPRIYGPRDRPDSDIARYTDIIVAGHTIDVPTDKDHLTDYVFIEDVVQRMTAVLTAGPGSTNVVYNVGNKKLVSTETILSLLEKYLSRKATVRYGHAKGATAPAVSVTTSSHSFIESSTPIAAGVKAYVDWYRQHERSLTPCLAEGSHSDMCFEDGWAVPAARSRELTAGCKIVVYTVATFSRTWGLHPGKGGNDGCEIAFINKESVLFRQIVNESGGSTHELKFKNWIIIPLEDFGPNYRDTRKPTRLPKISPKNFFDPGVLFAVYGDYTMNFLAPASKVVEAIVVHNETGEQAAFTALHGGPAKVAEEFENILRAYRGGRKTVTYYRERLIDQSIAYEKYLAKYSGLKFDNVFDGGYLVHNLQSSVGQEFRIRWYREYQKWSDRDQLSGAYVLGVMNYEYNKEEGGQYAEWLSLGKNETGSAVFAHLPPRSEHCWVKPIKNIYYYQRRFWADTRSEPRPKPKPTPQIKVGNITRS